MVKGAISCIVADLPQACGLSRHLGIQANKNCRIRWVNKSDRVIYSSKLFNEGYTRRRAQTDVVVQQMNELMQEHKYSVTKNKVFQTMAGIRRLPCPLEGVEVDPHTQCMPDFDHFFDLGLCMRLLNYIEQNLLEIQMKEVKA